MLEVRAFRGLRYNKEKTGSLDGIITPPYDVISPEERATLGARSPFNHVHLILPEDAEIQTRYEVAAQRLSEWRGQDVLRQDEAPSYYLLKQDFTDLDGRPQTRKAFFGVVRIPEEGENTILGHERTFDKPVADRLALTAAAKANLGAVFGLYGDAEGQLQGFLNQMESRPPDGVAHTIDGVQQSYWRVADAPEVGRFLKDKTIYIADGHHRFLTAKTYRDEQRAQLGNRMPETMNYVLMGFVAFEDAGLKIYPPHRLVKAPDAFDGAAFLKDLEKWFRVEPVQTDLAGAVEKAPGECVIGLAMHGHGEFLLTLGGFDRTLLLGSDRGPSWRDLDVAVLHRGILERILALPEAAQHAYEKNVAHAIEAAHRGQPELAFILRATKTGQIRACAEAREPMPQKSTYFFPKLPSGVVIYALEG
ncbi:MAG: DUF1015 domain-containing protein [Candidatus Hydrogenedentes bacterium]|nr:DUF1015 domain-containing protein [Candidatus Hydrogenedentota bacterium]